VVRFFRRSSARARVASIGPAVRAEADGRYNRYRLVDDRIRDILDAGESVVRDKGDRLTSCLVLATEELA
jgi:hypothetical protein